MKNALPGREIIAPAYLTPGRKSQSSTSVWIDPNRCETRRYTSVFILAITQNPQARIMVETNLAAVAVARGLKATRSIDFYPGGIVGEGSPNRSDFWDTIKARGCDSIFTVSLLDVKSELRYLPGTGAYDPCPLHEYYDEFDAYNDRLSPVVSQPGYYTTEKTYFLEGNVFDAATGKIRWSMQSIAFNPSDLESFSKEYALLLVDQLNRPGA
jgi:hypothetical protein